MTQLPIEILHEIFLYLQQRDKVECTLVCHHWRKAIEELVLYQTVSIFSVSSLDRLTKNIQEKPNIARRVKHLYLFSPKGTKPLDASSLLALLPHVKTIVYYGLWSSKPIIKNKTRYPWYESIQHLDEVHQCSTVRLLLSNNTCPNLTTLRIRLRNSRFLHVLKNAPALKNLTLINTTIGFNDLNVLHEATPRLESLSLDYPIITMSQYDEKKMKPSNTIVECIFKNMIVTKPRPMTEQNIIFFLIYITIKYPSLSNLTFLLSDCYIGFDVKSKVKHIWAVLFRTLGPRLKKLRATYIDTATLGVLDRLHCQMDTLQIDTLREEELRQSQQIYYIQTLVLTHIPLLGFNFLKEFQILKKLKLMLSIPSSICLNKIITNSPLTLRALSIEDIQLTAHILSKNVCYNNNIKSLSLYKVDILGEFDTFVSQHLFNVTNLKLKACNLSGKTMNLPTLNLSTLRITEPFLHYKCYTMALTTLNDNKSSYYCVKRDYQSMPQFKNPKHPRHHSYPSSQACTKNDESALDRFTIVLHSVREIVIT